MQGRGLTPDSVFWGGATKGGQESAEAAAKSMLQIIGTLHEPVSLRTDV